MEVVYKICSECGESKLLMSFPAMKNTVSGKADYCSVCRNIKSRNYRAAKKAGTFSSQRCPEKLGEDFKADGSEVHKGIYTYERVKYVNSMTDVEIYCTTHKKYFWQTPSNHKAGKRCPDCAKEVARVKRSSTIEEWTPKAVARHGDDYNYLGSVYINNSTKMWIHCNACGEDFEQTPADHLSGCGCSCRAKYGYSQDRRGSIYVLACEDITKIGITNRDVQDRVKGISKSRKGFEEVFSATFEDGDIPYAIEWSVLRYLRSEYKNVEEKFDGYTECFYDVDREHLIKIIKQSAINIQRLHDNY